MTSTLFRAVVIAVLLASTACTAAPPDLTVYVGTYTDAGSRGIYRFELDTETGSASDPVLAGAATNPSFLVQHPRRDVLYAVNEVESFGGARAGAVSAFGIDRGTGALALLGQSSSGGAGPCHLAVDRAGRNLLVANYVGGSVVVLPLDEAGHPGSTSAVDRHTGTGPNASRQEGPHAHAIVLDASERFALSADLGADSIFMSRFDTRTGRLEPGDPGLLRLEPGSGPRHLAFDPSGKNLYLISELLSTVTLLHFDSASGGLEKVQTVTTLPAGFSGQNTAAEIAATPDGRHLYASNRGDDSLALFTIDAASGTLSPAGHVPSGGRTPRHFAIDASGRWLVVANQDSDSIVLFRIEARTGRPVRVGTPLVVSRPACILFAPAPGVGP